MRELGRGAERVVLLLAVDALEPREVDAQQLRQHERRAARRLCPSQPVTWNSNGASRLEPEQRHLDDAPRALLRAAGCTANGSMPAPNE